MKKTVIILAAVLVASLITPIQVHAAEDYSDTAYWSELCTNSSSLSEKDIERCKGYRDFASSQSDSLKEKLKNIDAKRAEISKNIDTYVEKIKTYETEINEMNVQIDKLDKQIASKQKEIDKKQEAIDKEQDAIDEKQEQVDLLRDQVGKRIEKSQDTMRLNVYVEVLMGAKTFEDFIRIANALSDVTDHNKSSMVELNDMIIQLQKIKAELEADKEELKRHKKELEDDKAELKQKQDSVIAMRYEAQLVSDELNKQLAEQNTNREMVTDDIDDIQKTMQSISDKLDMIAQQNAAGPGGWQPSGNGFYHPIPGAHLTPGAGSFQYASGALHLGADYGVNVVKGKTPIVAIGQGVILYTYNGCGDGYMGSSCGAFGNKWQTSQSSWAGGGNQIVLLFVNNGSLYAAKYYHLYINSISVKVGDIVQGGQQIATVGTSGSSTGTHLHIELFHLGDASQFSSYAQNWDGELEFHTGWGYDLYNHLCDRGASAPCKIHPESVFGR